MELLAAKQVSEMTGVPVGTLRYWRHSDIGPASFTLGRRVVYRRDEVLRWISQRENATRRGLAEVFRSNHPITQHGSSS